MAAEIKTVAVVGTGQMGGGIAQVMAQGGCTVLMADVDLATAQRGRQAVIERLESAVTKGKMSPQERAVVLENLRAVGGLGDLAPAELVVEAVSENEGLKREIFRKLDTVLTPGAVLASNTSSISITRLGSATQRPDRVIGMHFMNPVPVMKLVEVIRGVATSDATYAATRALAQRLGKTVVTSQDYAGFIVNRILMPMINEAAFALHEGVASADDIDAAMKLGTNQPMGPLALADFVGLDTCLSILEVMYADFGDPKFRPCPLLRRLVDCGRLGKKSGHGFHKYTS